MGKYKERGKVYDHGSDKPELSGSHIICEWASRHERVDFPHWYSRAIRPSLSPF